jgi:2-amino-4-hydroxy-6-hydroxymethyldihydropteridine diphosphokinase
MPMPDSGRNAVAYLGLGSSLGDRRQNLRDALKRLQEAGITLRAVSPVYESPHLGLEPGDEARYPPHLNLVAEIETDDSPEQLLECVQGVEAAGGRQRLQKWGPRTIDMDILAFDDCAMQTDRLTLPHPGIALRAFVARPLCDIAPDFRLPDGGRLRERLNQEPIVSQPIAKVIDNIE